MTNHARGVTVQREYARLRALLRWLHPDLAMEICRLGYQDARKRKRDGKTDMQGEAR